ncbi:MAG: hypothetical protein IJA32_00800 [Lachnospiraceae bacterium]|nr:hypothetical protein [Lachnospiraceae bacterium]
MKEKKKLNGWLKIIIEVTLLFFIFIAGLVGSVLVTGFLGLARVGMDNRYAQFMKQISIELQMSRVWMVCALCFFLVCVIFTIIAIKEQKKQIKGASALLVFSLLFAIVPIILFVNGIGNIKEKQELSTYIKENYTEASFNEVTKDMTEENYDKFIESLKESLLSFCDNTV